MSVTIRDVARRAGTSAASVSAALNGAARGNIRVGAETKARIFKAAEDLGYVPNPIAKSLATGRSGVIGLVFPYADAFVDRNPFCSQVMNGVFGEAIRDSFNLMLYTAWKGYGDDLADGWLDPRVDGLVLVLPAPHSTLLHRCLSRQMPCVSVICPPQSPTMLTVNADEREGGRLATQHLIDLGHRRIAMLQGTEDICTNRLRREGYLSAHIQSNIAVDPSLIITAGFDWKPGYEATKEMLAKPRETWPTAIFAVNDLCAEGCLRALREADVRVPEDIALVGYDDTWYASMTQPALTSVRLPIAEMGAMATRMLVNVLEGKEIADRQPEFPVSLTIRESCGASQKGSADSQTDSTTRYPS